MIILNNYKSKICDFYKNGSCINKNNCSYAHGEEELRCIFDDKCINEKCRRIHLKRDKNIYINKEKIMKNNDINLFSEKEFPSMNNIKHNKHLNNNNLSYSEIIKKENSNILDVHENKNIYNFDDEIKNIKKKLKKKYINLIKIDKNDWSNSFDIENIEREIKDLRTEYEKIKTLYNENLNKDFDINLIYLFDKYEETNINENNFNTPKITVNININNNETNNLINDIENKILKFNEKMKQIINKEIKDNNIKFILLGDLNKIYSDVKLFKYNYKSIKELNND